MSAPKMDKILCGEIVCYSNQKCKMLREKKTIGKMQNNSKYFSAM